jgi:hypothetical protein
MQLTETERQTLVHCLNVAADQFDKDAATVAAEFGPNGRTVKTFQEQAKTARLWAEKLENAVSIEVR